MQVCQPLAEAANFSCHAIQQLEQKLAVLRQEHSPIKHFEDYEGEIHKLFIEAEQSVLAEDLTGLDIDVPAIEVSGVCYHRVLRSSETYQSAVGPVRVLRTLYRNGKDHSIIPLELQAGIVEGYWTPKAAKQAVWMVAQMPPGEAKSLLDLIGNMTPSESSLARLPKKFNAQWEPNREAFEDFLWESVKVPEEAVTAAASLDGVMLPMKDGKRQEKREQNRVDGKRTRGPAGCQEASCGTLSFYDAQGERSTVRMSRMPESKKVTLKQSLSALLSEALRQRPDLTLVKVADGAKDNWTYLANELPEGHEVVDFYHAAEHLKKAFDLSYGENSNKSREKFITYRHILKEEPEGVEKVIKALAYQHKRHPRRSKLKTELEYFRSNRTRMNYAEHLSHNLPIGSGVIEATCKTLVTQRMKCSGMRWRHPGGQGILTARSLIQSGMFDNGWKLLAVTYCAKVTEVGMDNVIPFPMQKGDLEL
ncbi:ISKra4 family transposase [Endozoicomonas montiporae CL-33]|uniref:ISKra4 family transposase n=1 Tax=Endozoicomonas montiporae CL-33 TaxID=570277 RepID=A0A142BJA5_9GAMM|nr:hypothetical protein [Endozoicomonas montiporae]AMO58831.1 ISKra4 family transposase [Endozoicomonas montiporae CL-33]